MACAMGDEEGRKWPQMRRWNPNSAEGAPNGKSGFIILIALGAFGYYAKAKKDAPPKAITNPVYAEFSVVFDGSDRSGKALSFVQAADDADCKLALSEIAKSFASSMGSSSMSMKVESSSCKTELPAKYAQLFENTPAALTYMSVARGNNSEREFRMFVWGVSVEESDAFCDGLAPKLKTLYKGKVRCIRAVRP